VNPISPERSGWLLEPEAMMLLQSHGFPFPRWKWAATEDDAVKWLQGRRRPVVAKVVSPAILHKSNVGGVVTGLRTPHEVADAFRHMSALCREMAAPFRGVLLVEEAGPAPEVIVGLTTDEEFDRVVLFGAGGVTVELYRDVSFRPLQLLSPAAARRMIEDTKVGRYLAAARVRCYDVESLVELLVKVGELALAEPRLTELDLNPVRVYDQGALVLDVRLHFDSRGG